MCRRGQSSRASYNDARYPSIRSSTRCRTSSTQRLDGRRGRPCSNANDVGKERSSEQAAVPWPRLAGQATTVLLAERPVGVFADTVSRKRSLVIAPLRCRHA